MQLSLSDVEVFVLPALLVACAVLYGMRRGRRSTRRAKRLACADAIEPPGLRIEPDMYCDYALQLLPATGPYAFPVIVGNRFLGFFGRSDASKCDGRDLASTYVGTVMTAASYCGYVCAATSLEWARRQLRTSRYPMLPVLDKEDRLLGFVTEESIERVAAHALTSV